jgi:glycosyltransferase involved in cell wall biosynthesis
MHILGLFLNHRPTTGGHKRYLELLRGLAERGHEVTLIVAEEREAGVHAAAGAADTADAGVDAPTGGAAPAGRGPGAAGTAEAALIAAGVRLLPVATRPPRLAIGARLSAARRWRRAVAPVPAGQPGSGADKPEAGAATVAPALTLDVILIFGEGHMPAASALSARSGAPIVVALRSNMLAELEAFGAHRGPGVLAPLLRRVEAAVVRARERRIAREASRIIFQTERDRVDFARRRPEAASRTAVVANSLNASWFDPALRDANCSDGVSRLIYVGTLNRRKGVDVLLDATARLIAEGRELTLEIVGTGPLEAELRRRIASLDLEATVTLTGSDPAALERIAGADLLVLPSLYDSFPNVLLEALHTGTPAVAADAGGAREILAAEELLVPPADAAALAAAIRRLAEDPDAFRAARDHMRRRREAFDFDWVGRFEVVVEEVHDE